MINIIKETNSHILEIWKDRRCLPVTGIVTMGVTLPPEWQSEIAGEERRINIKKGEIMMKKKILRIAAAVCLLTVCLTCSACGKQYTCYKCKERTSKAYYDLEGSRNHVMCEDCARKYWMPLPIDGYRVK